MSLWSLFIALTALAVALSMRAAVWRPRDRLLQQETTDAGNERETTTDFYDELSALQSRVDTLETEVDDLHRMTTSLREENEYLQQRLDAAQGGFSTGGGS